MAIATIPGFIGCKADSNGFIIGPRGRILKPWLRPDGYSQVGVRYNGSKRTASVHRLMATAFLNLDFDDSTVEVDHKNGIRNDNRLTNLQLLSKSKNISKSYSDNWMLDNSTHKVCRCCSIFKLRAEFGRDKSSKDGLYHYCKGCARKLQYGHSITYLKLHHAEIK